MWVKHTIASQKGRCHGNEGLQGKRCFASFGIPWIWWNHRIFMPKNHMCWEVSSQILMGILNTSLGFPIEIPGWPIPAANPGTVRRFPPWICLRTRNWSPLTSGDSATKSHRDPWDWLYLPTFGWYGWWVEVGSLIHCLQGFSTIPGG